MSIPFMQLRAMGQSPWCDQLSRELLESGQLQRMVSELAITGVSFNPAGFHDAVANGRAYDDQISDAAARGLDVTAIYQDLVVRDVQAAADLLRPVYESTNRRDGYVSVEISPSSAGDSDGSAREGMRLWTAVMRPNLMIGIPATEAGLPAVTRLLSEAVNVNVTPIFGSRRYQEVLAAHAAGLQQAKARGLNLRGIASVAGFFVSHVDTLVDRLLELKASVAPDPDDSERMRRLMGRAGIANAKACRTCWEEWHRREPMQSLFVDGAQAQRLLWASTGTKNPVYRDVLYVEELIGADTVNSMPLATLAAFADHGCVRQATLTQSVGDATEVLTGLATARIKMDTVAAELESIGATHFAESYTQLLEALHVKTERLTAKTPA